ncbi:hypothetical protein MKZ38_006052 [Zalerion maritima]|uniref:Uncharacterized protein n=1 Tax=Zalerion maritima TaxID=339359 RepID=A0AAD5RPC7_9PEZI|nr:hypothetical protein MKZ38_006052 [Zalerion maritima]
MSPYYTSDEKQRLISLLSNHTSSLTLEDVPYLLSGDPREHRSLLSVAADQYGTGPMPLPYARLLPSLPCSYPTTSSSSQPTPLSLPISSQAPSYGLADNSAHNLTYNISGRTHSTPPILTVEAPELDDVDALAAIVGYLEDKLSRHPDWIVVVLQRSDESAGGFRSGPGPGDHVAGMLRSTAEPGWTPTVLVVNAADDEDEPAGGKGRRRDRERRILEATRAPERRGKGEGNYQVGGKGIER